MSGCALVVAATVLFGPASAANVVRSSARHQRLAVGEGDLSHSNHTAWRFPEEPLRALGYFEDLFEHLVHRARSSSWLRASSWDQGDARLEEGTLESVGSLEKFELAWDTKWHEGHMECGMTYKADVYSDKWDRCPQECPLFAKNKNLDEKDFCQFVCVGASTAQCSMMNPAEPVVDTKLGICRSCWVAGCESCHLDGSDSCSKCSAGFDLQSDGTCSNNYWFVWILFFFALFMLVVMIGFWMFDLSRRPIVNAEGLRWGLECRSMSKLHQPKQVHIVTDEEGGETRVVKRSLWPLNTNLLNTEVAGPGILLQFNFQFMLILWGFTVAFSWYFLGTVTDPDLTMLGTHEATTPRQNCIVVAYGYAKQQELMPTKVGFVFALYTLSFLFALLHSVRQLRMFQQMDEDNVTHKDFAVRLYNLPKLKGDVLVEEEVKKLMAEATGEAVVGASVAWDYKHKEERIIDKLEEYMKARENVIDPSKPKPHDDEELVEEELKEHELIAQKEAQASAGEVLHERLEVLTHKSGFLFRKFESFFMHPSTQRLLTRGGSKIKKRFHTHDPDHDEIGFEKHLKAAAEATGLTPRGRGGETSARSSARDSARDSAPSSHRRMGHVDSLVEEQEVEQEPFDVDQVVAEMESTSIAFVVFETEPSRDAAIEAFNKKEGGVMFHGNKLEVEKADCEPDTVYWPNLAIIDLNEKVKRTAIGLAVIALALVMWAVCFYLPYAYFVVFATNFDGGNEPSFISGLTFSMVVVLGNAIMYLVCSEVSDRIGFHHVDDREVVYMGLYAFACVSNVVLDLATTYQMSYGMMVGKDMRTWDGIPLKDIHHFTDRFETYAMQRALGEQLMAYSFPATFLIPFFIEPIATILMPYKIMSLLIRSHKDVTADEAEGYLGSLVMDLSRYADLMLNVMLAVLVFFFPGGFVLKMFFGFALAHCWIYLVDQYRVLKVVRKCNYAAMRVDWWVQWMLSIPLGLISACLVCKTNCKPDVMGAGTEPLFCIHGTERVLAMAGAFVAHILLHTLLLVMVVPLLGRADEPPSEDSYRSCAESNAASFFTANPIYCLRSIHVYKHKVPCDYCIVGKEHMIRKSEEIGQYFEDHKAEFEDFNRFESMSLLSARQEIFNFARDTSKMLGNRLLSTSEADPSSPKSSTSPTSADQK